MDTTTTEPIAPEDDAILPDEEVAQSTPASDDAAANSPSEPTQTTEEPAEPSIDENLEWLSKKGIDPSDPEAVKKLADMYRNAEKEMHKSKAEASNLKKSLEAPAFDTGSQDQDLVIQLAQDVQALKLNTAVNAFWTANPEAKEQEAKMAEIVTERPEIGQLVRAGHLTIQDLYNLAVASDPSRDDKLKADGGKEALRKVASKQQAKAVVGNATSSDVAINDDAFLKAFEAE